MQSYLMNKVKGEWTVFKTVVSRKAFPNAQCYPVLNGVPINLAVEYIMLFCLWGLPQKFATRVCTLISWSKGVAKLAPCAPIRWSLWAMIWISWTACCTWWRVWFRTHTCISAPTCAVWSPVSCIASWSHLPPLSIHSMTTGPWGTTLLCFSATSSGMSLTAVILTLCIYTHGHGWCFPTVLCRPLILNRSQCFQPRTISSIKILPAWNQNLFDAVTTKWAASVQISLE